MKATSPKFIDLTGKVFGDLSVLCYEGQKNRVSVWQCRCVCGKIKLVRRDNLTRGSATSCGCRRTRAAQMSDAGRLCRRCGLWRPATEFRKLASGSLYSYCHACHRSTVRDKYHADPIATLEAARRVRDRDLGRYKRNYTHNNLLRLAKRIGAELADVVATLERSKTCDICGSVEDGRRLALDHDHRTGKIRGVLCSACNQSIGKFKDSPNLLRRAAEYLERANA